MRSRRYVGVSLADIIGDIKADHPQHIVFVQCGSFWEVHGEDASWCSKTFGWKIANRGRPGVYTGVPTNAFRFKERMKDEGRSYVFVGQDAPGERKVVEIFTADGPPNVHSHQPEGVPEDPAAVAGPDRVVPRAALRQLRWVTASDAARSKSLSDYDAHEFSEIVETWILPSRRKGAERKSLENAAAPLMSRLASGCRFAALNVPSDPESLQLVWAYLIEPGFRQGCDLIVTADFDPEELDWEPYTEDRFGYARSLQCLRHLLVPYRARYTPGLGWLTEPERRVLESLERAGAAVSPRLPVAGGVVDLAVPLDRLAVEIDENPQADRAASAARDDVLRAAGWRVMRFEWEAAFNAPDGVAATVLGRPQGTTRTSPSTLAADAGRPSGAARDLDPEQTKAAQAGAGVVQVLAPAGSGKTTTLVARVEELVERGVPQRRILCTTFNKATRIELSDRLEQAELKEVCVRTFNSLGLSVLVDTGCRKETRNGGLSTAHWKFLCREAQKQAGTECRIEFDAAAEIVSDFKLGRLMLPDEALAAAVTDEERTKAQLYRLYQEGLDSRSLLDFDDQILLAIRRLREDKDVRDRWQAKFDYVLVDEYQDIEPSQELLILLLAAPQNNIFAVGDEDQCIYSWRRAAVERIVELDQQFPGLHRVALETVYRCPPRVVASASRLIAENHRRFLKTIRARDGHESQAGIGLDQPMKRETAMDALVAWAKRHEPRRSAILARTNFAVEDAAFGCAKAGVPFRTEKKFTEVPLHKVEIVVRAYARLALRTGSLEPSDIDVVFATPSASLPQDAEHRLFTRLDSGCSLREAVAFIEGEDWRTDRLDSRADFVDSLSCEEDAERFVRRLRSDGGLDRHFAEEAQASPHQPDHLGVLRRLESEAQGVGLRDFALQLEEREKLLRQGWSEDGINILTVHGAKGREWDHVFVFGIQEGLMPLEKCADLEEERRLAYVAMTRAKKTLDLQVTEGKPSRFLREAGLLAPPEPPVVRPTQQLSSSGPVRGAAAARTPRSARVWRMPRHRSESTPPGPKKERPKSFTATIVPCPEETRCRVCGEVVRRGADSRRATFSDGTASMVHPACAMG